MKTKDTFTPKDFDPLPFWLDNGDVDAGNEYIYIQKLTSADNGSALLWANEGEVAPGFRFKNTRKYDIDISNNPPELLLRTNPAPGTDVESDFKDYYRAVHRMNTDDQIGFQVIIPQIKSELNNDIACMIAGSRFP